MKNKHYTHINRTDRQEIDLYLQEGKSHCRIGKLIGKSKNTIHYEIKQNSTSGMYDWKKAQAKARLRRRMAKYQGMKMREDLNLRKYVEEKIQEDWSPEEISGRLKYVDRKRGYISFFAIYRYLETAWGEKFKPYLRYRGKRYKAGNKSYSIVDRIMIDDRPKSAEKRRIFGHWEADFIVSGKNGKGALLVFVERKTRHVLIFKLRDRKVATINFVFKTLIGAQLVVKSLTIDNDVCFRQHKLMSRILGAPIFFCHPYHSWEKGTVENMNKWIRQYIKKGSDISLYSKTYIQFVQDRLNNRPRKCLGFRTPWEALQQESWLKKTVSCMLKVVNKQKTLLSAASYFGG